MKIKDFIEQLNKLDPEGELVEYSFWKDHGASIPNISTKLKVTKRDDDTYQLSWTDTDYLIENKDNVSSLSKQKLKKAVEIADKNIKW